MSRQGSRGVDGEFADGRYEYVSRRAIGCRTSVIGIEIKVQQPESGKKQDHGSAYGPTTRTS
jgi:hypothetical protein